jgi:hypothetical protein
LTHDMYLPPKEYGAFFNSRCIIENLPSSDFKFIFQISKLSLSATIPTWSPFLDNDQLQKTTLTGFFIANKQAETEAAAAAADDRPPLDFDCRELLYQEFPIQMTWNRTYR